MNWKVLSCTAAAFALSAIPAQALTTDKVKLNGNMTLEYLKTPGSVDSVEKMFSEGMLYGRLRWNTFYYDFDTETASNQDNRAMGVGGSLVYKTASLAGISGTLGLYTSQNPEFFREDKIDVGFVKSGKDTFDRNKIKNGGTYDGHFGMTVLAQAYLQYDISKTSVVAGRQMFESVFTASNDTKMIPNTFDGVSATVKEVPDTAFRLAYFTAQKLRDHTDAHDVIAYSSWDENDDSAVNKSLTPALVGTDNKLVIATVENRSVKNLKLNASYALVPGVVSDTALEAYYKIPMAAGWSLTPGIRYMMQKDRLNALTPVANLKGDTTGYTNPNSLDGNLIAGRLDFKNGPMMIRLGYSEVDDKADIIAPWRGFPTGGFTRAMAQFNWYANTKTSMVRFDYDFGKAGLVPGFKLLSRFAMQDFDDAKSGVQADSDILHIDLTKELASNLEMKVRLGFVEGDDNPAKSDVSYNEYRLEFNYLF